MSLQLIRQRTVTRQLEQLWLCGSLVRRREHARPEWMPPARIKVAQRREAVEPGVRHLLDEPSAIGTLQLAKRSDLWRERRAVVWRLRRKDDVELPSNRFDQVAADGWSE